MAAPSSSTKSASSNLSVSSDNPDLKALNDWSIPYDQVTFSKKIGKGFFGEV